MVVRRKLVSRASMMVIGVMMALPAAAQTSLPAPPPPGDQGAAEVSEIVVTGVRASLNSAQELKRHSDQIVDSIQAQDIGKLPDANTVESLQRIAGVQIQRRYGEGGTDVDHRTQPAIAIRGLTQCAR
jgi:iron complex outermembrane receptor protein